MSRRLSLENRLAGLVCAATAIPCLGILLCLWLLDGSLYVMGAAGLILLCLVLYASLHVRNSVDYQFRSLQNLLDAVTTGDYSLRISTSNRGGALSEVVASVNLLVSTLQNQKQRTEEHQLLLDKVIEQIDVAILAWDASGEISFMNPSARQLVFYGMQAESLQPPCLLPATLQEVGNLPLQRAEVRELPLGETGGRFRLYKDRYFIGGDSLTLLFITNVDALLKKEEKRAWQNLIRVISHEINNSLVPLASMSEAMCKQVRKREQDEQLAKELEEGLGLIRNRSESLSEFLARYRLIANMPEPVPGNVVLPDSLQTLRRLFPESTIALQGEEMGFSADEAQFEQLMINLIKNAVEAQEVCTTDMESKPEITITWERQDNYIGVSVADRGHGIQSQDNLFTPLYTTRKQGQGIGLVLCRQIAEAHGGSIALANRQDGEGCVALVKFPCIKSKGSNQRGRVI